MADYRVEFTATVVAARVEGIDPDDSKWAGSAAIALARTALAAVGLSLKFPEVTEIDRLGREGEEPG